MRLSMRITKSYEWFLYRVVIEIAHHSVHCVQGVVEMFWVFLHVCIDLYLWIQEITPKSFGGCKKCCWSVLRRKSSLASKIEYIGLPSSFFPGGICTSRTCTNTKSTLLLLCIDIVGVASIIYLSRGTYTAAVTPLTASPARRRRLQTTAVRKHTTISRVFSWKYAVGLLN